MLSRLLRDGGGPRTNRSWRSTRGRAPRESPPRRPRCGWTAIDITAIGKELGDYDALDTGLFVCAPALFDGARDRAAGRRHDAERRHPAARRARADARRRRRRGDLVRHRHARGSRDGRNPARAVAAGTGSRMTERRTPAQAARGARDPVGRARASASCSSSARSTTSTSALAFGIIRQLGVRAAARAPLQRPVAPRADVGVGVVLSPAANRQLRAPRARAARGRSLQLSHAARHCRRAAEGRAARRPRRRTRRRRRRSRSSASPTWSARR